MPSFADLIASNGKEVKLQSLSYMDPVRTQETAQHIISAAARILEFERFVDCLEDEKRKNDGLPLHVERRLRLSMRRASSDVDELAQRSLGLFSEAEAVGVLDELVVAACNYVKAHDEITMEANPARAVIPVELENVLVRHGMSRDTWRWTLSNIEITDGVVKCNGSSLEYQTGQLRIPIAPKPAGPHLAKAQGLGTEAGTESTVRELKASDLSAVLGLSSPADGGGVQLMSLIGSALHGMTNFQRTREHETIRMGLQVTKLGFGLLIIVAVVVVLIAAAIFFEEARLGIVALALLLAALFGADYCKTDETGTTCVKIPPADDSPVG